MSRSSRVRATNHGGASSALPLGLRIDLVRDALFLGVTQAVSVHRFALQTLESPSID